MQSEIKDKLSIKFFVQKIRQCILCSFKKPIEVAVELNLKASKTSKLYKDYLKLEGFS